MLRRLSARVGFAITAVVGFVWACLVGLPADSATNFVVGVVVCAIGVIGFDAVDRCEP